MKTSVIGYPRIGALRELKFASEKYFKGEISQEELKNAAKEIRINNLKLQKDNGIDLIPTGDFSFYDNLLDVAQLLNAVPKRYKELNVSELDTYFAMARGYQKDGGDVKALPMKKWFNTNYHYIVPEVEDDAQIRVSTNTPFELYEEAKANGIDAVPSILGGFTFLKLARFVGSKTAADFEAAVIAAYKEIISKFKAAGAKIVRIDEPYLVRDLSKADIELFQRIYNALLADKAGVQIYLQTYFGDIRDCADEVFALDFDAIGLDFIEGKKTEEIVKKFPSDKILIAGLVNGKNIWRTNYAKVEEKLATLKAKEVILGTSCSLLHVPCTVKSETKLPADVLKHFAFAAEKLQELSDIASGNKDSEAFKNNAALFATKRTEDNVEIRNKVAALTKDDFIRKPAFAEREKIQKEALKLPLFPTTTIGSFPQTSEVRKTRAAFKKNEISKDQYETFIKEKIAECVKLQEEIGLDVLVHGEFERNDMVEYFGECLDGFLFTQFAWVQSYGTRCVKPPVVWGDISRARRMTVDWSVYTQSLTDKYVKGMLTGPVTILNWSFPREDLSIKDTILQIALAIRDEVLDLEANGIKIIQVDEAALREKLPLRKADWHEDYLDFAIPAFNLVHSGLKPETQLHTHMCYSEFTDIIPDIDNMDADVITFEASRSDLLILDALKENNFRTEVGPGVYDIHSPRIPSVEELTTAITKIAEKVDIKKLWVNPDCGLKTRGNEETIPSLKNLVEAAAIARKTLG